MATTAYPAVLTSAERVRHAWITNPAFSMGDLTLNDYMAAHSAAVAVETTLNAKRLELQDLVVDRNEKMKVLRGLTSRALSGFRAAYGPDSKEYDRAGGTRSSERQSRRAGAVKVEKPEPVAVTA